MSGPGKKADEPLQESEFGSSEGWEALVEDSPGGAFAPNPELEKAVRSARAEGRSVERELVALGSEGERRLLQVLAVPLGEEEPERVVVVLRDLTRVRHLETVRRDFVAALSHEIQTPLTAIRGYAETLAQTNVPSGDRDRYLSVILRNTDRLERLLEDLRLLSRAESGELPLSPAPVDLGEVCRSLLEDLEVRLREADLSARVESEGRAVARADRRALDHVLLNLLDNAIKYTPSGGRITVRIGTAADAVTVEVTDTGIGIPSGDLGRVFERFYRVDRARSRDAGGTGLGLAIVRHLLEGMGGSVTVESELDRGSTFRVNLPAFSGPG